MNDYKQVILMASYNEWMNAKLFEAAGRLAHAEVVQDRGAFFGSAPTPSIRSTDVLSAKLGGKTHGHWGQGGAAELGCGLL